MNLTVTLKNNWTNQNQNLDMSVLCQSTNLQKSLRLAKKGMNLEETQRLSNYGGLISSGSTTPFKASQKLQNISTFQDHQQ